MNSGKLRHYITIQQKTEDISSSGDVNFTWSTLANCFASVKTITGKEVIQHGKVNASINHIVRVRAFDATGVLPEMRIVWIDRSITRYLHIESISEDMNHDRYFELICSEKRDI